MTRFKALLLATLASAAAGQATAQVNQITPDAARVARTGVVRFETPEGFNLSAGAPTVAFDLVDVAADSSFIIEGPVRMSMEGFIFFVVDCAVYSGNRVIARYNRGAPVLAGPFEGRFRFGVVRSAPGTATGYACWANAYGNRAGANWRAYEVPNASVAGGQAQYVQYGDGRLWDGDAITEQVVLHFSGLTDAGVAQPGGPGAATLRRGPTVPDGSDVQWRPPIIPPGYAARMADARAGRADIDWAAMQDLHIDGPGIGALPGDAGAGSPQPVQAPRPQ